MKIDTLTKKEHDLMSIFWNSEQALSLHDIIENHPELNRNTVQAVLKKLLKADYIEVAEIGYSKTVLTRKYVAKLEQAVYIGQTLSENSAFKIALNYITKAADQKAIAKLEKAIEKRKYKLTE